MKVFSKIQKLHKIFIGKMSRYGVPVAFWSVFSNLVASLCKKNCSLSNKVHQKKHNIVLKWLKNNYNYFIEKFNDEFTDVNLPEAHIPKQIWICWWDGIDTMPPIVKACYNSVLMYANDFNVTLITKNNFNDYISIPDHVLEKVNAKIMTITHFSNIIRMSLLYKYGGLWLDATILVTGKINLDNISFFTIKTIKDFGSYHVAKRRWTGNCIGGAPKIYLFNFIREFLCEYWKNHDEMIEHHLYDYSIALAYNTISVAKEIIDNVRPNNLNYMFLTYYLENEYEPQIFEAAAKDTIFHKLTWKTDSPLITPENKPTLYGYILKEY